MTILRKLGNALKNRRVILVVSLFFLICFLLMVFLKNDFLAIDADVNTWSASIQNTSLTLAATIIHYIFDTPAMVVICLLIVLFLFYKKHKYDGLFLAGTMLGDLVILTSVKMVIHSARPLNGLIDEKDFSFPSGHVMSATVLFCILIYLGWQHWKSQKIKLITASIFFALLDLIIGFSRIYLNVHWLSDVVAGYLLGLCWVLFSIWVFQYFQRNSAIVIDNK
ncbi:MAG: phosphatase PAP2 family protein [Dehalococcoidia bacterium]|jgi:undecaprenyl-diphosphatase